jgi:hypothetical protein
MEKIIKKILRFITTIFLGFCISKAATAQQPKPCGDYKINKTELSKALNFERSNIQKLQSTHYLIRVYFHICRYDDGSHPGATVQDLNTEFATLQADYTSGNICFLNAGYDYINSTAIDTVNANQSGSHDLFNPYRITNCINIFYTYVIHGKNSNCNCGIGGIALDGIPGTFCLIANGNIGAGHTISHEVGHCLGLLHTFEASQGIEDIDESNCSSAGDLICNTKADPYVYANNACFAVTGCTYNGTCTDPNSASNYTPPYTNMMAYWWGYGCYPNLTITTDQFTRINSFLNTNSNLINCESTASITEGPLTINSGYLMTSSVNDFNTSGTVDIAGTANVTFGGQTVYLNPGFDAAPSSGGLVAVIGSSCNYTAFNAITKTNTQTQINASEDNVHSGLRLYPNPSSATVHIIFTKDENENDVSLIIYDVDDNKINQMSLKYLRYGRQDITLNVHDFLPGVYFVLLQTNVKTLSAKLIIAK